MKITKTFYYQYGSEYPSQIDYESLVAPSEIVNPIASIYINVPFKVKTIHVKNISYVSGLAGNQGNAGCQNYVTLTSSLVGNRPVGMIHRDSQFSMNTKQDIEHLFQIPEMINGFYDFTFYSNAGNQMIFSLTEPYYPFSYTEDVVIPINYHYYFDSFSITLEFNSEGEL
jgi:hypothetical protein